MSTQHRSAISAAFLALAIAFAPTSAALAATDSATDPESTFHEFVDDLALSPASKRQVEQYFAALPEEKQEAGAADPSTLFTYSEATSTVRQLPVAPSDSGRLTTLAAAGIRTLQVSNRQDVKIGNVTFITFSLSYTYEARGSSVTRNINCTGSASGVISASSSPTSWISQGRGTCDVRTQASVFVKGLPFQFTKVHTVTTQAGNPARVDGRIYSA